MIVTDFMRRPAKTQAIYSWMAPAKTQAILLPPVASYVRRACYRIARVKIIRRICRLLTQKGDPTIY